MTTCSVQSIINDNLAQQVNERGKPIVDGNIILDKKAFGLFNDDISRRLKAEYKVDSDENVFIIKNVSSLSSRPDVYGYVKTYDYTRWVLNFPLVDKLEANRVNPPAPSLEELGIKPGVPELFESNPDLAQSVYEALGFNNNNFELKENKEAFGKEPHPEGATSYDIFSNSRKIGRIALLDGKNPMIKGLNLNESERNKGLGKSLYKWLNYKATLKGGRLYADQEFISLDAQRVWESLNKEGLVDLTGASPKFNDKQKQQALQQYSQYLDSIFPDSKVEEMDNSLYISVLNDLKSQKIIDKQC
jgi:hypothetical protein